MALTGSFGQVRAAIAEERSRLGQVFDQIDEALERLEPGTQKDTGEQVNVQPMDVLLPTTIASSPSVVRRASTQPDGHQQAVSNGHRGSLDARFQVSAQPMDVHAPGTIAAFPPLPPLSAQPENRNQAAGDGRCVYKQKGHDATEALDAVVVAAPRGVPRPLAQIPAPAWELGSKGSEADGAITAPAPRPLVQPRSETGAVVTRAQTGAMKAKPTGAAKVRRSAGKRLSIAANNVSDRANKTSSRQIFANADQMKEQVQQAILQPDYDVRDMYRTDGCFQAIARHPLFDVTGLSLILLNAMWLGVETDHNDEALLVNADTPFIIVENFFCAAFCFELFVRFMAFKSKADIKKDSWFMFDSVLVTFMALETWVLSILVLITNGGLTANSSSTSVLRVVRLFRMTRAARVARLLKAVPELMVIGRGIVIVARTVVVIMCLLGMIIYTFAIVFTQLAKGTDLENTICSDMLTTMSTLLLGGILPDVAPATTEFATEDFAFGAFFFVFVLMAYVMIMNMLIGVLVEVVAVVASVEKEKNQVASVKRVLQKWTPEVHLGGDDMFGVDEFKDMLNRAGCAKDLNDVGVDAIALIDHADFVYRDKDELTFAELLSVVLGLRGRNDPKVQDLVQLRKFLHAEMQRIEMSLEHLHFSLSNGGESMSPCHRNSLRLDKLTAQKTGVPLTSVQIA